MRDRRIDQQRPKPDKNHQRRELHAIRNRTGDQRRGDDGEGHLEHQEDRFRDGGGNRRITGPQRKGLIPILGQAAQEEAREIADPGIALTKGQAIAGHHPQHGNQCTDGK